jgi:hypothetical protein
LPNVLLNILPNVLFGLDSFHFSHFYKRMATETKSLNFIEQARENADVWRRFQGNLFEAMGETQKQLANAVCAGDFAEFQSLFKQPPPPLQGIAEVVLTFLGIKCGDTWAETRQAAFSQDNLALLLKFNVKCMSESTLYTLIELVNKFSTSFNEESASKFAEPIGLLVRWIKLQLAFCLHCQTVLDLGESLVENGENIGDGKEGKEGDEYENQDEDAKNNPFAAQIALLEFNRKAFWAHVNQHATKTGTWMSFVNGKLFKEGSREVDVLEGVVGDCYCAQVGVSCPVVLL